MFASACQKCGKHSLHHHMARLKPQVLTTFKCVRFNLLTWQLNRQLLHFFWFHSQTTDLTVGVIVVCVDQWDKILYSVFHVYRDEVEIQASCNKYNCICQAVLNSKTFCWYFLITMHTWASILCLKKAVKPNSLAQYYISSHKNSSATAIQYSWNLTPNIKFGLQLLQTKLDIWCATHMHSIWPPLPMQLLNDACLDTSQTCMFTSHCKHGRCQKCGKHSLHHQWPG